MMLLTTSIDDDTELHAKLAAGVVTPPTDEAVTVVELLHQIRAGSGVEFSRRSPALEASILSDDLLPTNFLERGALAARTVCRIDVPASLEDPSIVATGFLVAPRLLLTNNHVIGSMNAARAAELLFHHDLDASGQPRTPVKFRLDPTGGFLTSDARSGFDYTLVAVAPVSMDGRTPVESIGFMRLDPMPGKTREDRFATIIQHPDGEPKMIALRENQVVQIGSPEDPAKERYIWYRADTAPGSSGAMVCNDAWQVLSIHHAGVPGTQDVDGQEHWVLADRSTMPAEFARKLDTAKVRWAANQGIRISHLFADVLAQHDGKPEAERSRLVADFIADARGERVHPGTAPGSSIVVPTPASPLSPSLVLETRRSKPRKARVKVRPLAYFSERRGFDETFLGEPVPMPTVSAQALRFGELAPVDGDPESVLRYQHFSVQFNASRRLAFCAAVNIDGRRWLGLERDADEWYFDPRIDIGLQIGDELYSNEPADIPGMNQGWFDRGHLVRRQDPLWGSLADVESANEDTFHWTNCSPQYWGFNRGMGGRRGRRLWNGLEDFVLANTKLERVRACVFNGPIFNEDDEEHRGIQIPRLYFKVIVVRDQDRGLLSSGYVVSQERYTTDIPFERMPVGPNDDEENFQVSIARIEELTGLGFAPEVRVADVFAEEPDTLVRNFESIRLPG